MFVQRYICHICSISIKNNSTNFPIINNSHNKYCNSMTICNYSTLLIGDSIIAGLSRYSNIGKR